jgi:hypothetical protein
MGAGRSLSMVKTTASKATQKKKIFMIQKARSKGFFMLAISARKADGHNLDCIWRTAAVGSPSQWQFVPGTSWEIGYSEVFAVFTSANSPRPVWAICCKSPDAVGSLGPLW